MKRLYVAAVLTVMLILTAVIGINYVKNKTEMHLETLNKAKEYAISGDVDLAKNEMEILNNNFKKSKKIFSLYIQYNAIENAEKEIKYTKTLADINSEDFVSQVTICEYYIHQLYEVEMYGLKTWF